MAFIVIDPKTGIMPVEFKKELVYNTDSIDTYSMFTTRFNSWSIVS